MFFALDTISYHWHTFWLKGNKLERPKDSDKGLTTKKLSVLNETYLIWQAWGDPINEMLSPKDEISPEFLTGALL